MVSDPKKYFFIFYFEFKNTKQIGLPVIFTVYLLCVGVMLAITTTQLS